MASRELHVIFGTGPLATAVMRALQKREKKIRMINRSGRRAAGIPPRVEVVAGELIFAGAGHPPQIGSMGRWMMRLAGRWCTLLQTPNLVGVHRR